jgi:methylated-DNA-[protein]-cysteine S-methyltransferase
MFKTVAGESPPMDDSGIYARRYPPLDRFLQVGLAQGRVISVDFPERPQDAADGDHHVLDALAEYLDGDREAFDDVTVALTVPTADRRVLAALRQVPYGESTTVAGLARMTADLDDEDEDDLRTVREALASNPAPILVPDHRVRDATGSAPTDVIERCRRVERL